MGTQLLDHFILNESFDYTFKELARMFNGAIPKVLERYLDHFVEDGILKKTGNGYHLNKESPRVAGLRQYVNSTINDNLDRMHAVFTKDPVAWWRKQLPKFFEKADKAARIEVIEQGDGQKLICYDENGKELTDITADDKTISQIRAAIKHNQTK